MGRVRNMKIDMERDLHNDLCSLHEQIDKKKEELLHFNINEHLDSIKIQLSFLAARLDTLEKLVKQKNLSIVVTEKKKTNPYMLLGVSIAIYVIGIYYKSRYSINCGIR